MATAPPSLTVEEYLHHTSKPACEYIDGILRPKSMPTKLHAMVQFLLILLIRKQGFEALNEVTVRVSPTKFLIPDVIAARHIGSPYPAEPVTLCVEILSPEERLSAAFAKCEEYHSWGVPYCWVIDPIKEIAWEYHAGADPQKKERSSNLEAGLISVSLSDLVPAGGVEPPTYGL